MVLSYKYTCRGTLLPLFVSHSCESAGIWKVWRHCIEVRGRACSEIPKGNAIARACFTTSPPKVLHPDTTDPSDQGKATSDQLLAGAAHTVPQLSFVLSALSVSTLPRCKVDVVPYCAWLRVSRGSSHAASQPIRQDPGSGPSQSQREGFRNTKPSHCDHAADGWHSQPPPPARQPPSSRSCSLVIGPGAFARRCSAGMAIHLDGARVWTGERARSRAEKGKREP